MYSLAHLSLLSRASVNGLTGVLAYTPENLTKTPKLDGAAYE